MRTTTLFHGGSSSCRRRAAFSLLEAVVSMGVMAGLMTGLGSAMMIASRGIECAGASAGGGAAARDVVDRITADLAVALSITERTVSAIEFTVPDRSGDGLPETIRYAWSENESDPITLECNGSPPVTLVEDVHSFDLTYLLTTIGPPPAPPEQESEEMVLAFHDDAPGGSLPGFNIRAKSSCGQCFFPALPTNTISWTITRVKIHASSSGPADGTTSVRLHLADASQTPSGSAVGSVSLPESALDPLPLWVDIDFNDLVGLDPSTGMCLTMMGMTGLKFTATVTYERDGVPMTPDTHFVYSWDGGKTWSAPEDTLDMRFYVYGTVTTNGEPQWP